MKTRLLSIIMALTLMLVMVPASIATAETSEETIVITSFFEGDPSLDYQNNYALQYMKEKTGVMIDVTGYVFASTESNTQKQLLLASGDYPEIFLVNDTSRFTFNEILTYGMKDGYFIPLNDLIKNAPTLGNIYAQRPEYYNMHVAPDGNIYSVCRVSECGHCRAASKVFVNMDWLDKLGIAVPTTTDEYYDMLVAFKTKDPNGNGIADEIPLTGTRTWFQGLIGAFVDTDAYNGKFVAVNDGVISFTANTPEFKEAMSYMRKLYEEGLVDPAIFTQESNQFRQTVSNEPPIAGAFNGAIYGIDMQNSYAYQNFRAIEPLKGPEGLQKAAHNSFVNMNVDGYFVITDKCKNPEAAMKWVDASLEPEASIVRYYGAEGHGWKYADPGQENVLGGEYIWEFLPKIEGEYPNETFSCGPILGLKEHRASWSPAVSEEELYTNSTIFEARIETETEQLYANYLNAPIPNYYFFENDEMSEYADLFLSIREFVEMSVAQFITGNKNLEADWDTYVATLDGYGVSRFVELIQKGYDMTYSN